MRPQANDQRRSIARTLGAMESFGFNFDAMSSYCEVRLDGNDEGELGIAAIKAIDEVRRIEQKYSRYRSDSLVGRINAAAGSEIRIEVDEETAALFDFAAQLHALSDGAFDITSGVLRRAWDFRAGRLPEPSTLVSLLPLIGWSQVEWHDRKIRLPRAGMEIDFGGFGKEYAADRACAVLQAAGQRHGYVNLGGDIRVLGARSDGTAWRFGIQHPRDPQRIIIASVQLSDGALATSGDYERHFVLDGKRYCHILDPRTGWPVQAWSSISVVAPACVAAGALSTIAMLLGEDAVHFLETQRAGYLAIDTNLDMRQHAMSDQPRFSAGAEQR